MSDTLLINTQGLLACLNAHTGNAAGGIGAGVLKLFTTSAALTDGTTLSSLQQASFPGTSAVTLVAGTWGAATSAANLATAVYGSSVTFQRSTTSAAVTCYGCYLTNGAGTQLWASATFASGPYTLATSGDSITTTPTLTYQSLY